MRTAGSYMSMTSFFKKKNEAKVYAGTPNRTQLTASESSITARIQEQNGLMWLSYIDRLRSSNC